MSVSLFKLNIVNQARWARFCQNRRGFWSLWIFMAMLILVLLSNVLANDKPLLARYQGHLYVPFMVNYSETTFGGELETPTDYQDPFVLRQIEDHGWAVWAPIRSSYHSINFSTTQPFPSPPSTQNWLGTDSNGHDVLAQILYGLRISLFFGILLTVLTSVMGIMVGATQGYYGGLTDLLGQRFIEVWSSIPTLFLIIILASVVQPNFWWLLLITVLSGWMTLVSVVRAEFLRTRNFDYIRAAQAMGVSDRAIMWRHMLPNAMVATLTYLPFILCGSITTLTSLDFLGFGLPLGSPSLGTLLMEGKNNLQAPWLGISAFVVLATLLSLLIFIGEAVRDAFNPSAHHNSEAL
ncbi:MULTISPECIES: ABC transporter permease [Rahnella]|jgi:microcin C transport system permease protein|uniref:ABC transporter permease n=1 Tax=Rahnella TaxID=34037 RepID=UPI0010D38F53|nr:MULTISPECIES: microcin C ABC transporter permease [Rahnella]TDS95997.1 microcin C transport system permease protein [Rahnella sp. BIGb0236]UHM89510.1 microcin C ABC transporter permease [Rahnella victoriana]